LGDDRFLATNQLIWEEAEMKRVLAIYLLGLSFVTLLGACVPAEERFPYRWFRISRSLNSDSDVEEISKIARVASEHGLNGMMLSASFSAIDGQPPEYFTRLNRVKELCDGYGIETVPIFLSAGYGTGLSYDKNLAAGLPVRDSLFVVQGEKAVLRPDHEVEIVNSGFEDIRDGKLEGFASPAELGEVAFEDREVFKEGRSSLRFENFAKFPRESGRLNQAVKVRPYRSYVLSCWMKAEGMDPPRPFSLGHIRFEVYGQPDGRRLQYHDPEVPADTDWVRVAVGFNSWDYEEAEFSIGAWTSENGRFWIDDLQINEVGLVNILRRPGTPVVVRGEKSGTVYEEGKDFAPISDPELNHRFDHEGPVIQLLPDSRIKNGEQLRVSWYHSATLYQRQVSVCMSEPKLYEIWGKQVQLVAKHLAPNKYFLSMDEIRAGGGCEACKSKGMSMGEILGECATRQYQMIKAVSPEAEVFIWSDMFDPHHNGLQEEGEFYYLVDGKFNDSWKHIPKDMIIGVWGRRVRTKSLEHFSGLGFRTIAAAYYDTDDLEYVDGWLEALEVTPGGLGIMYTTWLDKYDLLADFGDLISQRFD
jgi:hypothetical protein